MILGSSSPEQSFPRRQAVTRRFTLGAPRNLTISPDGERVVFLRSGAADDPVNALWVLDLADGVERLLFDPSSVADLDDLPAAERARRERAREAGEGIVGFSIDALGQRVAFVVAGRIMVGDVDSGLVKSMDSQPGAFDPVISPDGSRVAYVSGASLRVTSGNEGDSLVVEESAETVSWGAAEFVAGEEMGRTRGFWWSPDSDRLLVERVDVAPVEQWWIGAPVSPASEPIPIRYPAAGTPNAEVGLAIIDLDGRRTDVAWDASGWEYLADATWSADGLFLTVQSRDQRTLAVLDVDPHSGEASERHRVTDPHWVELVPGAPRLRGNRLVTIEDHGVARRLCIDGRPITSDDTQVRSLVSVAESGMVITASIEPTSTGVALVSWDGDLRWLSKRGGVNNAVVGGGTLAISRRSLEFDRAEITVTNSQLVDDADGSGHEVVLVDNSEAPTVDLHLSVHRLGSRGLASALLLPADAKPDDSFPILLDPYGGPHAQRVVQSRSAFHASQWFADHGFAVLVTDGRGTPGRGPEFEREVRGDLAAPVLEDQIEALHAAASLDSRLDLGRVAIRGWSFGGYLSAMAVLRRPDVFHAAVAGAPVTDWRLYDTHYTERYLGDPRVEPDNYDLTDLAADVKPPSAEFPERPLLLIHGLADDNVVAAHTLRLSRTMLEAGRSHAVLPLSGVTHMTPQEEVAENLLLLQLRFLKDALAAADG